MKTHKEEQPPHSVELCRGESFTYRNIIVNVVTVSGVVSGNKVTEMEESPEICISGKIQKQQTLTECCVETQYNSSFPHATFFFFFF